MNFLELHLQIYQKKFLSDCCCGVWKYGNFNGIFRRSIRWINGLSTTDSQRTVLETSVRIFIEYRFSIIIVTSQITFWNLLS